MVWVRGRLTHINKVYTYMCRVSIHAPVWGAMPFALSLSKGAIHPRMCGEHTSTPSITIPSPGSSPHVRGTLLFFFVCHGLLRFIPACAGNTVIITPQIHIQFSKNRMSTKKIAHNFIQDLFPHLRLFPVKTTPT
jgi:hypothetical protein